MTQLPPEPGLEHLDGELVELEAQPLWVGHLVLELVRTASLVAIAIALWVQL